MTGDEYIYCMKVDTSGMPSDREKTAPTWEIPLKLRVEAELNLRV